MSLQSMVCGLDGGPGRAAVFHVVRGNRRGHDSVTTQLLSVEGSHAVAATVIHRNVVWMSASQVWTIQYSL